MMQGTPFIDGASAADADLRLRAMRISRMEADPGGHWRMFLALEAEGSPLALEAVQDFANASWLNDLSLPFLDDLLNLPDEPGGGVSLREEGWASLESDGQWVRVSDSYGDVRCALVAWAELRTVMQLKRRFLCLMRDYKARGVPRYGATEGFRVRLHAPGFAHGLESS